MTANWKGKPPQDANGVVYIGDDDSALPGWVLYRRASGAAPWVNMKLIRIAPGNDSANYWLSWHTGEQRFANSFSTKRVPADVLAEVQTIMADIYPSLSESDLAAALEEARMLG